MQGCEILGAKKIKIALVGCGYWGKHFLRLCMQHPQIQLSGVFDSSESRISELQQLYPDVHFYQSLDSIATDADVAAVIVATGLSSHFAICHSLLQAGKHLLCEKPLTLTAKESEALGQMADANGLTLLVGHTFEYNSAVLHAKHEIDRGALGDLKYLSFRRCGNGPIRDDADVVYDLATHDVSIANLLLNSVPEAVNATGYKLLGSNQYDLANIDLIYPTGLSVNICVSWMELVKQREMKVIGSKGMLLFNDVAPSEKIRLYHTIAPTTQTRGDFGDFQLSVSNNDVSIPNINYKEPLREELEHFMACINGQQQPRTGWRNAANVVRVLEAIEDSIGHQGQSIKVAK